MEMNTIHPLGNLGKYKTSLLWMLALVIPACSTTPELWGVYLTPTPNSSSMVSPSKGSVNLVPIQSTLTPPQVSFTATLQLPLASPTTYPETVLQEVTPSATFDVPAILYYSQSGDTLASLASRFNVQESDIHSNSVLPTPGLIDPGSLLVIPDRIEEPTTPNIQIMPDNEVILSATALDFDISSYIHDQGGYLSSYRDYLGSVGWLDGDEAIRRLAFDNSINPRLLLGLLEYESRWVSGQPSTIIQTDYPMGYQEYRAKGLSLQMNWAINQIFHGYYGWRTGRLTELQFEDGTHLRLDPRLNAGTVAIQYLFSKLYSQSKWSQIIDENSGFPALYSEMFGDPWVRTEIVNPIFPPGLSQPLMVLPFEPHVEWNFISGPHGAWIGQERDDKGIFTPTDFNLAALDFGPSTAHGGCEVTPTWVVAALSGLVVRSANGVVIIDSDGDGHEQTGWNLLYLHIATKDRVKQGTWVEADNRIGHASCEGGVSKGTHTHIARKYNGEWIAADGPIPFVLSGWQTVGSEKPYQGKLEKGDLTVTASDVGEKWSNIFRDSDNEETTTSQQ